MAASIIRACGSFGKRLWTSASLNIHCSKSLTATFGTEIVKEIRDRFTVHYTPIHGSWLKQAEIEIGMFSRQCLGTRRISDLKTLRRETRLESPNQSRWH